MAAIVTHGDHDHSGGLGAVVRHVLRGPLIAPVLEGIVAALNAAAGTAWCAEKPADGTRPNLILIMADDLGWNDTSINGSTFYQTPNLERLADRNRLARIDTACRFVRSGARLSVGELRMQNPRRFE